jgi:hypothetical protein
LLHHCYTVVTLQTKPDIACVFERWTGDPIWTQGQCTITITVTITITITINITTTITITIAIAITITITITITIGIVCNPSNNGPPCATKETRAGVSEHHHYYHHHHLNTNTITITINITITPFLLPAP